MGDRADRPRSSLWLVTDTLVREAESKYCAARVCVGAHIWGIGVATVEYLLGNYPAGPCSGPIRFRAALAPDSEWARSAAQSRAAYSVSTFSSFLLSVNFL